MAILMMLTVAFYAHKNGWGADVPFEWPRVLKAVGELLIVLGWPTLIWLLVDPDIGINLPPRTTVLAGLVILFVADSKLEISAVLPIMTPALLIGGMTTGGFTA